MEDYLKQILKLQETCGKVTTKKLAEEVGVAPASVTDMVKKLAKRKLVNYKPYGGVTLSPKGRTMALKVLRRHRLVELFLYQVLGMPWEKVHQEAEIWEHFVSEDVETHIDKLLGYPKFDPHGSPIPNSKGKVSPSNNAPVYELETNQSGIISEVKDEDPELLSYLSEIKLIPGTVFKIISKSKFDGLITLKVQSKKVVIGKEVSHNIYAKKVDSEKTGRKKR